MQSTFSSVRNLAGFTQFSSAKPNLAAPQKKDAEASFFRGARNGTYLASQCTRLVASPDATAPHPPKKQSPGLFFLTVSALLGFKSLPFSRTKKADSFESAWCEKRDLNPYGVNHTPLKRARLPVPPLSHIRLYSCGTSDSIT